MSVFVRRGSAVLFSLDMQIKRSDLSVTAFFLMKCINRVIIGAFGRDMEMLF